MQLAEDTNSNPITINAYGKGCLKINQQEYREAVVVTCHELILGKTPSNANELRLSHLQFVIEKKPEVLIIGTGETLIFLDPEMTTALQQQNIGIEIMNTSAACRTLSILMTDNRDCMGILFI